MRSLSIALLAVCATSLASLAHAEPPSGSYVVTVDGNSVVRLLQGALGDESGWMCYGEPLPDGEPICQRASGYTNSRAQVTARYEEQFGGDVNDWVNYEFWGDLRRRSKATRIKLDVSIGGARTTDVTTWLSGGGKVSCRDDLSEEWRFTCAGKLEVCSSLVWGEEGTCEKRPYTFVFPEVRAPWQLELDLETTPDGRVEGQARAVLPTENSQVLYFDVVGKHAARTDTVKLKIHGEAYGSSAGISLSKGRFVGDQVVGGRLKYKLTGQSGVFEIQTPFPDSTASE